MRKLMTGIAFAAAVALCGGSAFAVDQSIVGKKLLILNPGGTPSANNKVVYLSKDTSIAIPTANGAEDPRCVIDGGSGAGGVLTVSSTATGESATVTLPCGGWTVNGAGTLFKYKDPTGATCKIVLIKGGKLQKAVCKGTAIQPYDLSADQVSVDVLVRTGTAPRRWCATFSALAGCTVVKDGSDQKKYLAKNCTLASVCPASPSGAFLDDAGLF